MKATLVLASLFAMTLCSATVHAQLRIGTYDSRAVAIAYFNSPAGQKYTQNVMSTPSMEDAKKDEKLMKELRSKGRAYQTLNHLRGFSTGSVAELLTPYKEQLAAVANTARVQVIVSKYEPSFLAANAENVDVTDQIVAMFSPSEKALGWVQEAKKNAPMPMLEVLMIPAEE
jgi:hypothetical protein